MEQVTYFVGTDVSKDWLDMCIYAKEGILDKQQIKNKPSAVISWLRRTRKLLGYTLQNSLFTMEFTGIYNHHLLAVLVEMGAKVWVIPGAQITESKGLERGKSDQQDAQRIALYAAKNIELVRLWNQPREIVMQLKTLLMLREKHRVTKHRYETTLNESREFNTEATHQMIVANCKPVIELVNSEISRIEKEMKRLIASDQRLEELDGYIQSVDQVGLITSVSMIVTTNEFINIKEAKKYACYSGVVPFMNASGKLRKRERISHKANKNIKKLLHLLAVGSIRGNGELKQYYDRKVAEGKPKMSVLNAIRNKIILRIFACVNERKYYQKDYCYNLDVS
ncbi:transposase [Chitinophaga horti]|uniref:Transposase n=1 Tax=Chitinophaga horti TaxID=2920382 RepID=A0ABY6J642_9BACT|nr:transposase [Chitinophaga horti]UYQ91680.1 transposase [Chitinophaga horti]UYQ91912.1 transposase [Chitinophaga horti]UYQ95082.1 transposase [Chitinophaga horti]